VRGFGVFFIVYTFAFFLHAKDLGNISIVSLSPLLSDLARQVGGDRVDVVDLMELGADPHQFQMTPGDLRKLKGAQLLLISGRGLEGFHSHLQTEWDQGAMVFVASEVIPSDSSDPHWWHSVALVEEVVQGLRDTLTRLNPEHATDFRENARNFMGKLEELDRWIRLEVVRVPIKRRILVMPHDAMEYFAKAYGFRLLAVEGISPSDQPSSRKVQEVIHTIRENQIPVIFSESRKNPRVMNEILDESGAKLGGTLYVDGLGVSEARDYVSMMRHNVTTIVEALQ